MSSSVDLERDSGAQLGEEPLGLGGASLDAPVLQVDHLEPGQRVEVVAGETRRRAEESERQLATGSSDCVDELLAHAPPLADALQPEPRDQEGFYIVDLPVSLMDPLPVPDLAEVDHPPRPGPEVDDHGRVLELAQRRVLESDIAYRGSHREIRPFSSLRNDQGQAAVAKQEGST